MGLELMVVGCKWGHLLQIGCLVIGRLCMHTGWRGMCIFSNHYGTIIFWGEEF